MSSLWPCISVAVGREVASESVEVVTPVLVAIVAKGLKDVVGRSCVVVDELVLKAVVDV